MLYSLHNIKKELTEGRNPVKISRVYGSNKVNRYVLLNEVSFYLSNGIVLTIEKGYTWDLSSVPRVFWVLLPPDGDFQIASLIHDYLYEKKINSRKFADNEMLKWSEEISGTKNASLRNLDNNIRFLAVRLFGWLVYNK